MWLIFVCDIDRITKTTFVFRKETFYENIWRYFLLCFTVSSEFQELKMLTKKVLDIVQNTRHVYDGCASVFICYYQMVMNYQTFNPEVVYAKKCSKHCRRIGLQQFYKFHVPGSKYIKKDALIIVFVIGVS
jgi:hypothetical protein